MNYTTPATLYLAEDGSLSERLIRVAAADLTHWRGNDVVIGEFRCFRRSGIYWAKTVSDKVEAGDIFYRLTVRRLHCKPPSHTLNTN